ncbi:MAG: PorT family protein [Flavobacteriales bacterium]|nr:PorT family protein [Flavobacteriales bacterium]
MTLKNVLVFSLILFSLHAFSQADFKGGLNAGLITSQVEGDTYAGFYKVGLTAGAQVEVNFSKTFGAGLGISYVQKGSRNPPDTTNLNYFKLSLHYMEVPLSAQFTFKKFLLGFGPYAGVLMLQRQYNSPGIAYAINPPYDRIEIGAHIGVRYQFGEKWFAHARFSQSILPIRAAPKGTQRIVGWDGAGSNTDIRLMLGYLF